MGLHQAAAAAVEQTVEQAPIVNDLLAILVSPPRREEDKPKLYDRAPRIRKPVRRNYLEIESRNQALGLAGEKLVLEFEHKRLWVAGRKDLANRIEHVADSKGDHLGFDILSFETEARERLIEVKTTSFGSLTPFLHPKTRSKFPKQEKTNTNSTACSTLPGNQNFLFCPARFAILVRLTQSSIRLYRAEIISAS